MQAQQLVQCQRIIHANQPIPVITNSFRIGTTTCYPDKNDAAFFFCLPEVITPERDSLHRPTIMLLLAGGQSLLQLGVRWELDRDTLDSLMKAIVARFPTLTPSAIRLSMPTVTVGVVELLLGDGSGTFSVLASSPSSGFPPYSVIFNQSLSPTQQTSVTAALTGRMGFLKVRYPISLQVESTATTTLTGDVAPEILQLQTNTFIIDPTPMLVEQALRAGRLVLTRTRTGDPNESAVKSADNQAMQRAAALLRQMAGSRSPGTVPIVPLPTGQSRTATLTASASVPATTSMPWDVITDISAWFTSGEGLQHIVVGPGGGIDPVKAGSTQTQVPTQQHTGIESKELPVRLSFVATETNINFIVVKQGANQVTLHGPDYAPVSLPVIADSPIQVTVEYTDGGPAFVTSIAKPEPDGWVLTPSNLGLTQITVDTTELFQPVTASTATQPTTHLDAVRIHIRYQPSGNGTDDDRTLNFRARDLARIVSWYVVSRAAGLDGILTYDLKLTPTSGPSISPVGVTTHDPMIRLTLQSTT